MRRRDFLHTPGAGSALAFLPAFTRHALADAATLDELTITSVEILELSGPEKPGFGIELDSAKVEKQEVLTRL